MSSFLTLLLVFFVLYSSPLSSPSSSSVSASPKVHVDGASIPFNPHRHHRPRSNNRITHSDGTSQSDSSASDTGDRKNSKARKKGQEADDDDDDDRSTRRHTPRTLMDYESISLALRLTCEINRRLLLGSSNIAKQQQLQQQRTTSPNIFDRNNSFISSHPSSCLSAYVKSLSTALGYSTNPLIPAIAFIYLDRAASLPLDFGGDAATSGGSNISSVPYLTSKNVHKLYLAAIVLACRAVRNEYPSRNENYNNLNNNYHENINSGYQHGHGYHDDYTRYYASLLRNEDNNNHRKFDNEEEDDVTFDLCGMDKITDVELGNMLECMVSCLMTKKMSLPSSTSSNYGNDGLMIHPAEVDWFLHQWKNLFSWEDEYHHLKDSNSREPNSLDDQIMQEQGIKGDASTSSSSKPAKFPSLDEIHDNTDSTPSSSSNDGDQDEGYFHDNQGQNMVDDSAYGSNSFEHQQNYHPQHHHPTGTNSFDGGINYQQYGGEEMYYSQEGNPALNFGDHDNGIWWSA